MTKHVGLLLSLTLLAGCAGLTGQPYMDELNAADVSSNGFGMALAREYRDLANAEWDQTDYADGLHFARKGLAAAKGEAVAPDDVASRTLPEFAAAEISAAHDRLVVALASGAGNRKPDIAAKAQARFDCWMEQQEENHQPEDIAACHQDFEDALKQIAASRYVVFFDSGSTRLSEAGRKVVAQAAADAQLAGTRRFEIVGHADTLGRVADNVALSRARAQAVKAALVAQGFVASHIHISGSGEAAPLVATADSVTQAENRRVEIINYK